MENYLNQNTNKITIYKYNIVFNTKYTITQESFFNYFDY